MIPGFNILDQLCLVVSTWLFQFLKDFLLEVIASCLFLGSFWNNSLMELFLFRLFSLTSGKHLALLLFRPLMTILLWVSAVNMDQPWRFKVIKELQNVFIYVVLGLWQGSLRFVFFMLNLCNRCFGVRLASFLRVNFRRSSHRFLGIFCVLK